ncbi:MAG: hypothetical protein ACFBSG_11890, partial [Leptolyngbyaceae cyanobacterium]
PKSCNSFMVFIINFDVVHVIDFFLAKQLNPFQGLKRQLSKIGRNQWQTRQTAESLPGTETGMGEWFTAKALARQTSETSAIRAIPANEISSSKSLSVRCWVASSMILICGS